VRWWVDPSYRCSFGSLSSRCAASRPTWPPRHAERTPRLPTCSGILTRLSFPNLWRLTSEDVFRFYDEDASPPPQGAEAGCQKAEAGSRWMAEAGNRWTAEAGNRWTAEAGNPQGRRHSHCIAADPALARTEQKEKGN
jgi:hypothetical protein